jgi:hypothetical protein|eukprot:COSAG01_NODE_2804_length_7046_cov_1030.843242_9_plen_99_part_00
MTGISLRKICSDHEIRCRHGPAAGASCVLVSQYPPWGTDATSLAAVRKDPEAGIRIICECRTLPSAPKPAYSPVSKSTQLGTCAPSLQPAAESRSGIV